MKAWSASMTSAKPSMAYIHSAPRMVGFAVLVFSFADVFPSAVGSGSNQARKA
jgi:hypothetical protein